MAKNRNTYAKRQREQEKKQRAELKRAKKHQKRDQVAVDPVPLPDEQAATD